MKELELYLHIPFCVKKCNYCDFLSAPAEEETAEEPIPVDNPLVNDVKVSGNATQNANASAQTAQPQQSQPVDDDLMAIFNILDRK